MLHRFINLRVDRQSRRLNAKNALHLKNVIARRVQPVDAINRHHAQQVCALNQQVVLRTSIASVLAVDHRAVHRRNTDNHHILEKVPKALHSREDGTWPVAILLAVLRCILLLLLLLVLVLRRRTTPLGLVLRLRRRDDQPVFAQNANVLRLQPQLRRQQNRLLHGPCVHVNLKLLYVPCIQFHLHGADVRLENHANRRCHLAERRALDAPLDDARGSLVVRSDEFRRHDGRSDLLRRVHNLLDAGHAKCDVHRCYASKVESLEGHLCPRLTDALRSNRTHGRSWIHELASVLQKRTTREQRELTWAWYNAIEWDFHRSNQKGTQVIRELFRRPIADRFART
mmetsp:Transcript_1049/g.2305  ORF Transcript_1049/g.2305 Transcript_1049/m.2305 type:complete len:342 (-) Transcript_1049:24-1049(-)